MTKLLSTIVAMVLAENNRNTMTKRSLITIEKGLANDNRLSCIGFGQHILPEQLCDGEFDCPDKSDEFACVQMQWSDEQLPSGCKSGRLCSKNYRYQYMPTLGECVDCDKSDCVPCDQAPRFVDYHSCLKNCKLPTSIRQFKTVTVNFLYQQRHPHLFEFFSQESWSAGQLQPVLLKTPKQSTRNKARNFALRGVLLIMMRERHANRYVVQMYKSEDIGPVWFDRDDATVSIALKMKRDKDIQPGREYILTGHTEGNFDGAGRLIVDNGIFRKSKSRSIRREMRRKFG